MDVRIEDVSAVEKKLIVEVPWDTVSAKLRDAYRALAKDVRLKGFRKGKVPRSVLERMFGKRVHAEVATQLVRESFISAATEHKLDAVSEPQTFGTHISYGAFCVGVVDRATEMEQAAAVRLLVNQISSPVTRPITD